MFHNSEVLKSWDLFPSPPWIVELLLNAAEIKVGMKCLEPSAGFGSLARSMQALGADVVVIEPILELQASLTLQEFLVVGSDFLTTPNLDNSFDRVVQNPPFSQQISHLKKAFDCLVVGGTLVSLFSNSPWQYNTSFYRQFRWWLSSVNAEVQQLPWGQFVNSERYTEVECYIVKITKTYARNNTKNKISSYSRSCKNFKSPISA